MRRGIAYVRVSGKTQKDGASLEEQEVRIKEYCLRSGIEVIAVVQDVMTGKVYRERPGLSEVREYVRTDQVDCVVVYMYDRLTRNETHMAVLYDEAIHHNVELLSLSLIHI